MLGLAVLFFLALWIVGTLFAVCLGGAAGEKLGEKKGSPQKGKRIGMIVGFMLAMGHVFLYWALEMIVAETMVSILCATKAGIHIYLSPEEHARRVRDNNWEGVIRAAVRDEADGPYVIGKIVALDDREFPASNKKIAGEYGRITYFNEFVRREYPRHVAYTSSLYYDTAYQVPLFRVESFYMADNNGFKFWIRELHGCSREIDSKAIHLSEKYIH